MRHSTSQARLTVSAGGHARFCLARRVSDRLRAHGSPADQGRGSVKRRTALLVGSASALAAAAGSLFGGVFTESRVRRCERRRPRRRLDVETALSGFGRGSGTAGTIAKLEAELRSASRDPDRLAVLGLAYQVRWRETGDPGFLPLLGARARRGARRPAEAMRLATLGLGHLALIRHDFRDALALGRAARRLSPVSSRPVRRHRRRPARARPVPRGVRGIRADGRAQAVARLVRADRLRARADRRPRRGDSPRCSSRSTRLRARPSRPPGRTSSSRSSSSAPGASIARQRHVRAALTSSPGYVFALEQQARVDAARGRLDAAVAVCAARVGERPAAAVRLAARRPARATRRRRPRGAAAAGDGRGDRAAAGGERPARRPRVGGVPRRPRDPPGRDGAPRAARARRPALDLRRRRARLGARPGGPLLGGGAAGSTARCGSARRTRCSSSTAATRPDAPVTARAMRGWYRKALALSPSFSIRWAPVARRGGRVRRVALLAVRRRRAAGRRARPADAAAERTRSATSPSTTTPASSSPGNRVFVRFVARPRRDPDAPVG